MNIDRDISRRSFLKGTAALVVAFGLPLDLRALFVGFVDYIAVNDNSLAVDIVAARLALD